MQIKGVRLFFSPIIVGVFVLFVALFTASSILMQNTTYVIWGIPLCLLLIIIPMISSYNLGKQYLKLLPEYQNAAVPRRLSDINSSLLGHAVKVEGTVQTIKLEWLGRPRYTISDGTTSILTFRSYPFNESINIGDNVAILGMVVKKYAAAGSMSVHAVGITKIDEFSEIPPYVPEVEEKEKKNDVKIKKYN